MGVKASKSLPVTEKEELEAETSSQTLEDLKAIDEDIEKLRSQIEERDKIIIALREAAEAKDRKLDDLLMECSKLRSDGKMESDGSESNRATTSSPSSPPLCNKELCWTDNFVNANYHEPVYAQLLNDHAALREVYNQLREKLEEKGKKFLEEKEEAELRGEGNKKSTENREDYEKEMLKENQENAINLIMAEQIKVLKEREAQLMSEMEEMREQRDLMEFRILELEESRKEFLEKEDGLTEEKRRRDKMVWAEKDFEDVSDSGVMSLPTSEDLTSDSELGEAIRNYSPLGAVTNLGLPSPENSNPDSVNSEFKFKKSLKSTECLQESGIFEDPESSSCCESAIIPNKQTRGCQTESILDKTLLDFIDSSCDLLLSKNRICQDQKSSDDLTTEVSKLSVIQKRIQQKTKSPTTQVSQKEEFSCPHTKNVLFYEERLGQLEEKLKIYESSGDTKENLLAKRLQKEIDLSYRVKELTEKVTQLEETNKRLEEEKCEFEEAENDTRFQCQRLEIRLQELIEKNSDLEVELERVKVRMNEGRRKEKRKESLECLISKYEQRNFELEERDVEAKQKLSLIESAMPAIVAWNMFRLVKNPQFVNMLPGAGSANEIDFPEEKDSRDQEAEVFQRIDEILSDQKKLRLDYEKVEETAADRERALRLKIEELETKAAKDREMLEEMTNSLKEMKSAERCEIGSNNMYRSDEVDLLEKLLKEMVANEIQLLAEIERLEKKDQAYMDSLEKADEIWASMEANYMKRLSEAENTSLELQKRVAQLEETQCQLEKALEEHSRRKNQEMMEREAKRKREEMLQEKENNSLKEELKKLKSSFLEEEKKYVRIQKELESARREALLEKEKSEKLRREMEEKEKNVREMEVTLQNQILDLKKELTQKGRELSNLEVTVAELREEVETLENRVTELVEAIQASAPNQEEGMSNDTSKTVQKQQPPQKQQQQKQQRAPMAEATSVSPKESSSSPVSEETLAKRVRDKMMKKDPPYIKVLHPYDCSHRYLVFVSRFLIRQELKVLCPRPVPVKRMQMEFPKWPHLVFLRAQISMSPRKDHLRQRDEILQLSIKNTELQQILEKMEEESRLKEKELQELHQIALAIQKEQLTLELLCEERARKKGVDLLGSGESDEKSPVERRSKGVEETAVERRRDYESGKMVETGRNQSIDILQIFNPIVVKTSDHVYTSLSNLQIALNNLQNKCRTKNFVIKSLLDELQRRGNNFNYEEMLNQFSLRWSGAEKKAMDYKGHHDDFVENDDDDDNDEENEDDEDKNNKQRVEKKEAGVKSMAVYRTSRHSNSNQSVRSSPASRSSILACSGQARHWSDRKSEDVNSQFSFVAPIRTMRKIGEDGIFLEWDVTLKPNNVTGYEILVNGRLTHMVRSSTRNKALLHSLNLAEKLFIQLFAISEHGRSSKGSNVTYPDGRPA